MNKKDNQINLTIRFVLMVFVILLGTAFIITTISVILFQTGILKLEKIKPNFILVIFMIPSLIIGTFMSSFVFKRFFKNADKIIQAIAKIGQGDFDIELDHITGNEGLAILADNINKMAKELKKQEMISKDFINHFSHEFKTPIVSIQGFAKRLLTKELSEEQKQEYLEIIYEESSRLANLSNNTLFISKLDNMEISKNKKEFCLDEQIRQCLILLNKRWSEKEIEITLNLEKILYFGNEDLLKQIWLNLLTNAIKFGNQNGKILLSLEKHQDLIIFCITDNGVGMDNETLSRIYDKFYQADQSRAIEGNGLGLSIVKKIVTLVNGTINVKSEVGVGTTFTICLPIQ